MADATCETCPHFRVTGAAETLHMRCAVRPPSFVREPSHNMGTGYGPSDPYVEVRWPDVQPDDFCGEHPLRQRDRLAASFVPALIVRASELLEQGYAPTRGEVPARVALLAYQQADALLAERANQSTPATPKEPTR